MWYTRYNDNNVYFRFNTLEQFQSNKECKCMSSNHIEKSIQIVFDRVAKCQVARNMNYREEKRVSITILLYTYIYLE